MGYMAKCGHGFVYPYEQLQSWHMLSQCMHRSLHLEGYPHVASNQNNVKHFGLTPPRHRLGIHVHESIAEHSVILKQPVC